MNHARLLYALLAAGLSLAASSAAQAQFYVRSPEVHKGELEIEEHGALYSGPGEDDEGDGFGFAFRTLYEFSLLGGPDEILFGPLAKFVRGRDSATINAFFVGQVGEHVEIDSLELKLNWRLKRELNERWGLGVEGFSQIEDLAHAGSFDDQEHRLGPVAYYEFPHAEGRPEWKAAGGVLFGVSDAVSDFTYKFDVEVEF